VLCFDCDGYPPADVELTYDPAPLRIERFNKIVEDDVADVFVENAFIPERPNVKFE
jgi:hypothetical protein